MKSHALKSFHHPPLNLNCAQAVLHGYQTISGDQTLAVADFKAFGGGRAPGGFCGAIYAATRIAPESADVLKESFTGRIGAVTCKELRFFAVLSGMGLAEWADDDT
jgi:hypothetical protein